MYIVGVFMFLLKRQFKDNLKTVKKERKKKKKLKINMK